MRMGGNNVSEEPSASIIKRRHIPRDRKLDTASEPKIPHTALSNVLLQTYRKITESRS
jgi:hypothetical protein